MRLAHAICAVAATLALAGCGGASGAATSGQGSAASASATSAAASATATVTTRSTSTPAGAASGAGGAAVAPAVAVPLCRAAQLRLSFLGGRDAAGHGVLGFTLRNTSAHACATGGYPGILFLSGSGQPLPTTPEHTTDDFFGHVPLRQLVIPAGASFSFRLGLAEESQPGSDCQTIGAVQVIAPNDTGTLRVTIPGGASECGPATVSPVAPGDGALP
ncbi:MAG TPA: DUF4232 domain-containing protein [Solirubrobacteraceae bacterium]|nr:DUF4232 domain-containing protein [Solirubrobacteraceae bacterium]